MWCNVRSIAAGYVCVVLTCLSVSAQDGVWQWSDRGLTPDDPALWDSSDNWVGGQKPDASGKATFSTSNYSGTAGEGPRFIKIPDGGVTVKSMVGSTSRGPAIIIGDGLLTATDGCNSNAGDWEATKYGFRFFCPSAGKMQNGSEICADREEFGAPSKGYIMHRTDLYATSVGETRTYPYECAISVGTGNFMAKPPRGAGALSSVWTATEGSCYLKWMSGTKGEALPVGTSVSATGILGEGVYLKRIFNNDWIEISAPATTSSPAGGTSVSFAAFTPHFRRTFAKFSRSVTDDYSIRLPKYRAEDDVVYTIRQIATGQNSAYKMNLNSGSAGSIGPLLKVQESDFAGAFIIQRVDIELLPPLEGQAFCGFNKMQISSGNDNKCSIDVPSGINGQIRTLSMAATQGYNKYARLTKKGEGILAATSSRETCGELVVSGGGFVWTNLYDGTTAMDKIDVASGASYTLATGDVTAAICLLSDGSRIALGSGATLALPAGANTGAKTYQSIGRGVVFAGGGTIVPGANAFSPEDAVIEASIENDGTVDALHVSGTVNLGLGAEVSVPASFARAKAGSYVILRATNLIADPAATWSVSPAVDARGRRLQVSRAGNEIVLTIVPNGLMLVFH